MVGLYSAFSCPECETMEGVRDFCLDQPRDEIENLKCMHSKAAEYLTGCTENYIRKMKINHTK